MKYAIATKGRAWRQIEGPLNLYALRVLRKEMFDNVGYMLVRVDDEDEPVVHNIWGFVPRSRCSKDGVLSEYPAAFGCGDWFVFFSAGSTWTVKPARPYKVVTMEPKESNMPPLVYNGGCLGGA